MGFLDGLKKIGNSIIEYGNNLQICKIHFSCFDTNELVGMLRSGVFKKQGNDFKHSDCRIAVRMVLADRGYSSSQLNSIDKSTR